MTTLVQSRNYYLSGVFATGLFYSHHKVTQGYTQLGQCLGAGIGPGSEAQYLGVDYYNNLGRVGGFVQRHARDSDYVYAEIPNTSYYLLNVEMSYGVDVDLRLQPGK